MLKNVKYNFYITCRNWLEYVSESLFVFLTQQVWGAAAFYTLNKLFYPFLLTSFPWYISELPPITWTVQNRTCQSKNCTKFKHNYSFFQGDCHMGERPELGLKSTLLKQWIREFLRAGGGSGWKERWELVTGHVCLLTGLTKRKSQLSCNFMTRGSFTTWNI